MPRGAQLKSDQLKSDQPKFEVCNCLALRQANRHVTQFYDRFLASSGLRTTQFSILIKGLIEIVQDPADRRSKVVRLTETGAARLRAARAGWTQAQKDFEAAFGGGRAARLRDLLHAVAATELGAAAAAD